MTACMLLGRGWGCKLVVALRGLVDSSANHYDLFEYDFTGFYHSKPGAHIINELWLH